MPSQTRGAGRRDILRRAARRSRSTRSPAPQRRRGTRSTRARGKSQLTLRRLSWLAVVLVAAWILSMTLRPGSGRGGVHLALFSEKVPALRCLLNDCPAALQSLQFLWIDVLGNIAVFVPFGAGLAVALPAGRPLAFWKAGSTATRHRRNRWGWWLRLAALGAAFSLCIELAQLGIPGRATDIDDVILNTVGTLIGGGIAMLVAAVLKRIA